MQTDVLNTQDGVGAVVSRGLNFGDMMGAHGSYRVTCHDKDGNLKWEDTIENLITTAGKNLTLDTMLAGSSFTATPRMGLISATPTPAITDVQGTHAGWTEVGLANAPQYSTANGSNNRGTPAFSAAAAGIKATSAAVAFTIITTGGTVGGCFINLNGTNACDNTTGTLFSVGAFTGGNKAVSIADVLNVTYQAQLT
jgi:hypothetical protein